MVTTYTTAFIAVVVLMLCFSVDTTAQTVNWTGNIDSNWHKDGNWSTGTVPGPGSNVRIQPQSGNPFPVISTNTATVANVNIGNSNGGELTVSSGQTLTITNELKLTGDGKLYIESNGHVELTGSNFSMSYGNSLIDISTGSYTSNADMGIIGDGFNGGSGTIIFNGTLNVLTNKSFFAENADVTVEGLATINGTYNGDNGITNFNSKVDVKSSGVINLDDGEINFNNGAFFGNNGTVNLGSGTSTIMGNVEVESGGYLNIMNADVDITGNADFTSNGNMTIDSGSVNVGGSASVSSGGSFDLNNGNFSVGGNASFTNGGDLDAGNAQIDLKGDLTVQSGGAIYPGMSTVTFSGDGPQKINSGSRDVFFYNVEVKPGSTVETVGSDENTVTVLNDLTIDEGGSLDVQDNDNLEVQGDLNNQGEIESNKPYIKTISTPSLTTILVTYDQPMGASAGNKNNYSLNKGISISGATLNSSDNTKVTLTVSPLTEGTKYTLTANNVKSVNGDKVSSNHKKRFTAITQITYYSRTSGAWDNPTSWSTQSHTGPAASSIPNDQDDNEAKIGNNHTISVTSTEDISTMEQLFIDATGTLQVSNQGTLVLKEFIITGDGSFNLASGGTLNVGHPAGITAEGTASGNIQTDQRSFNNGSNYIYSGSAFQQTGSGLPQQVNNLTIDNNANVQASANIRTTGTLNLQNGSLIIPSGQALISNKKSIQNGNLVFKRLLSGSPGWRMISSPLSITFNNFLDGILTQGYTGTSEPSLQPNVLFYDETYEGTDNQRWRAPASSSTTVSSGTGYFAYLFGDVSSDDRYNDPLPYTLTLNGQEFEGSTGGFDFNVTYTTEADSGWNLVGNPFGASIDWDDSANWTKTNIDNTIYVWDPENQSYKTWNNVTQTGDLGNGLITPFQAFWVKANDVNPELNVQEDAKTFGGSFVGKRQSQDYPKIELELTHGDISNRIFFTFSEDGLLGKDPSDAYLLQSPPSVTTYTQLYSIGESNKRYVINNLPRDFGVPIEIPLSAEIYENNQKVEQQVNLAFKSIEHIPPEWDITLVDRRSGNKIAAVAGNAQRYTTNAGKKSKSTNDTTNVLSQQYKILPNASSDKARFLLKINPGSDGSGLPKEVDLRQNYPNPVNGNTTIRFNLPVQNNVTLKVYDILGRPVATLIDNQNFQADFHDINWNVSNLASGTYIYILQTDDEIISKKLTVIK